MIKKIVNVSFIMALLIGVPQVCFAALFGPAPLYENTTGQDDSYFTGAPDDSFWGLGGTCVTYDFGSSRILDGSGGDFNVYDADYGTADFGFIQVYVSLDGSTFYDVTASMSAGVRIEGDSAHGNDSYFRSYDLSGTGLSEARYIRIQGTGNDLTPGHTTNFDLDAVGLIHHTAVPLPGALLLLASGLLGVLGLRRRSS